MITHLGSGPDESRELKLVGSLELKILAVANDEPKLQRLLETYLAPLLLKADSQSPRVRSRVITLSTRLKTFIQPPGVVLPVAALLAQLRSNSSPVVRQLDLSFIHHSIPRLDADGRALLIPKILADIAAVGPTPHGSVLFNLFLSVLPDLKLPPRGTGSDEKLRESVGLTDLSDAAFVAHWLGRLLLLRSAGRAAAGQEPTVEAILAQNPALSRSDVEFLRVNEAKGLKVFDRASELKSKAIAFLASGAFTDSARFLPAVLAAASPDSRVYSTGEDLLRHSTVSLEDADVVEKLFVAHSSLPAPYRIRILTLLTRSVRAASMDNDILNVVKLDLRPHHDHEDDHDHDHEDQGHAEADHEDEDRRLAPVSGLERTKLHRATLQFLTWVSKNSAGRGTKTSAVPLEIIARTRDYIDRSGWPVPAQTSQDATSLRCTAYELIGSLITNKTTMNREQRISLGSWLFRSLSEDPTDQAVISIDSALSSLAFGADKKHTVGDKFVDDPELFSMLLTYMLLPDELPPTVRSVRHAAVKWANQCFPYDDQGARYIDIIAISGRQPERSDVVEEGRKGLNPWTRFANETDQFSAPKWSALTRSFFQTRIKPADKLRAGHSGIDVDQAADDDRWTPEFVHTFPRAREFVQNFPKGRIAAYPVALNYCKQMLLLAALHDDFQLSPDWETSLDARVRNDTSTRARIAKYISAQPDTDISVFLLACVVGVVTEARGAVEECLDCFITIASLASRDQVGPVAAEALRLLPFALGNDRRVRGLAAQAFGILAAHPANDDSKIQQLFATLHKHIAGHKNGTAMQLNVAEGAFLTSAHVCSKMVYYGRSIPEGAPALPVVELLTDPATRPSLRSAVIVGMAQLWTAGLGLGHGDQVEEHNKIIESFRADLKSGKEDSIRALGRFAVAIDETDQAPVELADALSAGSVGSILSELFALHELRQVEVHFSIGEAIAAAVARWESLAVRLSLDVRLGTGHDGDDGDVSASTATATTTPTRFRARDIRVKAVLDRLFADCKSTKPSLLRASGIWLFCIVQYCSELDEIKSRLREAQAAFMRLLGSREEVVQETASRGLSLVYERGDAAVQQDLTRDLVSAFTGTGPQLRVDQETELFEPGALATGDGQSVTSYRDIVNLAQEVGDQSLVYKFMSLAANAAAWSTRSAFGRFGLTTILSDSAAVDPKLYPKLYRYRFDPNPNVQRSMTDIWKAVVRDPAAVLDTHFDAIMTELLTTVLGREWRAREASCAAIADLVSGKPFEKYEKYYAEIWRAGAKVLDDIKGSVREAAFKMCAELTGTLLRRLEESGESKSTAAMMKEAMPFLLSESGIESGVEEVKLFATVSVLKICAKGGRALQPFIPTMVPQFLGLLSTIEPEQINFHYQRVSGEKREAFDRIRSAMVRSSPISDAIEECLRGIDPDTFTRLGPALLETVKGALGMPTKIGCSRVIVTLFTRNVPAAGPMAAEFLSLLVKQSLDANDEVSKGYAQAAAYVLRAAADADQRSFLDRFVQLYFGAEDEQRRHKVADAVVAVSKISPDQFLHHEALLLPLAYLGSHDRDEYTRKAFGEIWDQHAGSTGRTVARYADEICDLATRALDAAKWDLRHTGAGTVGAMVQDAAKGGIDSGSGQLPIAVVKRIWPVLERSLALKTFDGKERVLDGFPVFVEKARAVWEGDVAVAQTMEKIAVREAKRNNEAYKVHAYRNLWKFARARPDVKMDIGPIVAGSLETWADENSMEIDDPKGGGSSSGGRERLAATALEAVARGWSGHAMEADGGGPARVLGGIMDTLRPYLMTARFAAVRRQMWYQCAADLMDAAAAAAAATAASGSPANAGQQQHQLEQHESGALALEYLSTLDLRGAAELGSEAQRIIRAKAILAIIKAIKAGVFVDGRVDWEKVMEAVKTAGEGERSADVGKVLGECAKECT